MNVLISMCLCGVPCRYDGKSVVFKNFEKINEAMNLIPVCPEVIGGLTTPRRPAERVADKILTNDGSNVTVQYERGALETLNLAKKFNCNVAILKEYSPSCGVEMIYDGSFSGSKVKGSGITAQLLKDNGIEVFSDETIQDFIDKYIKR